MQARSWMSHLFHPGSIRPRPLPSSCPDVNILCFLLGNELQEFPILLLKNSHDTLQATRILIPLSGEWETGSPALPEFALIVDAMQQHAVVITHDWEKTQHHIARRMMHNLWLWNLTQIPPSSSAPPSQFSSLLTPSILISLSAGRLPSASILLPETCCIYLISSMNKLPSISD